MSGGATASATHDLDMTCLSGDDIDTARGPLSRPDCPRIVPMHCPPRGFEMSQPMFRAAEVSPRPVSIVLFYRTRRIFVEEKHCAANSAGIGIGAGNTRLQTGKGLRKPVVCGGK